MPDIFLDRLVAAWRRLVFTRMHAFVLAWIYTSERGCHGYRTATTTQNYEALIATGNSAAQWLPKRMHSTRAYRRRGVPRTVATENTGNPKANKDASVYPERMHRPMLQLCLCYVSRLTEGRKIHQVVRTRASNGLHAYRVTRAPSTCHTRGRGLWMFVKIPEKKI